MYVFLASFCYWFLIKLISAGKHFLYDVKIFKFIKNLL